MKNNKRRLIFCWIIVGLIFFIIVALPILVNNVPQLAIQEQNVMVRVFYSLLLCIPCFRAVQFFSNNPDFIMANKLSYVKYQQSGNIWAYYFDKFVYVATIVMVLFFALKGVFDRLIVYHYLSILLYGISALMVEIGVGHD